MRETQLALFTGVLYGAAHTISGHPFDTIKAKMQIEPAYSKDGALSAAKRLYGLEGMRGFFKGMVPPLWGSSVYRSIMMGAYEAAFTSLSRSFPEDHFMRQEMVLGIRPLVPLSSAFAAVCRCALESPIEYAKVMGQTGQQWNVKDVYRGFGTQVMRTTNLLMPLFTMLDIFRNKTDLLKTKIGTFSVTFFVSSTSYLVVWPLETMKNLTQAGKPFPGASVKERLDFLGGPKGLWRGVGVGTFCGGFRNGCGMIAMVYAQQGATMLGLRD